MTNFFYKIEIMIMFGTLFCAYVIKIKMDIEGKIHNEDDALMNCIYERTRSTILEYDKIVQ